MVRSFLALSLAVLAARGADAGKVKLWQNHARSDYDKAKLKHAVVSSEGVVRLSRQLKPFADIAAEHVWDMVEDGKGNLYLATGDAGKVFKVTAEGKGSVLYKAKDGQVLCLHLAADGTLFAGTGPSGQVIAIDGAGKGRVVAKDLGNYVWSLAALKTGELFAGTGPEGRIYRINDGKGVKAEDFYKTKQDHVLCVAAGPEGKYLYAGTDKQGVVYRINVETGKGFVLYQAPQAEVRSLLVTKDFIYAGTSAPTKKSSGGAGPRPPSGEGPGAGSSGSDGVSTSPSEPTKVAAPPDDDDVGSKRSGAGTGKGASSSPFPSLGGGENSVYRIATDGTVREIFRDKTLMLSLLAEGNRLLVGTGMNGQIFEIDERTRERSEIARLDHGQVHCLLRRKDGSILLGTGDPGKLYVLEDRFADKGTVVSEVLDAKIVSKWGALSWTGATPKGTTLTVATRSGNVAEPDDTWSEWSDASATVAAPTARFLQYRVTLTSSDPKATPELKGVAIRYRTTNQAPEIGSLDVPNLDTTTLENPRKLKIRWTATDPNEDELTYSVHIRKEGWKTWIKLEDDLEKKDYEWDTTTVPSGVYQVKVTASDRRDNAPEDALSAEKVSAPFPVSHEQPTVTIKLTGIEDGKAKIEATAVDPMVRLTEAAFALNGKKWTNVFPTDGLFDSKSETFRFTTETLRPGAYVLVLRVRDAAGNTGSADVLFMIPGKK
ncbi:MAG: hypothetical protein U0793_25840 [Gemmataceae bacterium]